MHKWALLSGAILCEVAATLGLRAFQDNAGWLALVVPGYIASFAFLATVLRAGMAVGVAYGIWGACGTALTAVFAALIFAEPFTVAIMVGIALIIAGVLLVELGSQRAESARSGDPA